MKLTDIEVDRPSRAGREVFDSDRPATPGTVQDSWARRPKRLTRVLYIYFINVTLTCEDG